MKHVEMIVEYLTDGDDFQYFDNHGTITRCRDCIHYSENKSNYEEDELPVSECMSFDSPRRHSIVYGEDYCSYAERREVSE